MVQTWRLADRMFLYRTELLQEHLRQPRVLTQDMLLLRPPIKAMSYFTSSLARHGWYGSLPKVEMPEKTESAYADQHDTYH
jgi:hypothetical protein